METATHRYLRMTMSDYLFVSPTRKMSEREFGLYRRKILVARGFDLARPVRRTIMCQMNETIFDEVYAQEKVEEEFGLGADSHNAI